MTSRICTSSTCSNPRTSSRWSIILQWETNMASSRRRSLKKLRRRVMFLIGCIWANRDKTWNQRQQANTSKLWKMVSTTGLLTVIISFRAQVILSSWTRRVSNPKWLITNMLPTKLLKHLRMFSNFLSFSLMNLIKMPNRAACKISWIIQNLTRSLSNRTKSSSRLRSFKTRRRGSLEI